MYDENELPEENFPQCNTIKNKNKVNDDEDQKLLDLKQGWPEWLPSDWCIHQNIDNLGAPSNVHYSNPKGKQFHSKEDVFRYIASHPSHIKMRRKIIRQKSKKTESISDEKTLTKEDTTPSQLPKWPEWLPQDWSIKRSHDNPCDVYFCSPDWRKFRSKDDVLNHIVAQSMNHKPKQIRRKRKIARDDQVSDGKQRRRRRKKNDTESCT